MANTFSAEGNIHVIDTVDAALVVSNALRVRSVRWVGATTAGHAAIITSSDDSVLWSSVAAGANHVEESQINHMWPKGFKIPTLASGKLYITLLTNRMS